MKRLCWLLSLLILFNFLSGANAKSSTQSLDGINDDFGDLNLRYTVSSETAEEPVRSGMSQNQNQDQVLFYEDFSSPGDVQFVDMSRNGGWALSGTGVTGSLSEAYNDDYYVAYKGAAFDTANSLLEMEKPITTINDNPLILTFYMYRPESLLYSQKQLLPYFEVAGNIEFIEPAVINPFSPGPKGWNKWTIKVDNVRAGLSLKVGFEGKGAKETPPYEIAIDAITVSQEPDPDRGAIVDSVSPYSGKYLLVYNEANSGSTLSGTLNTDGLTADLQSSAFEGLKMDADWEAPDVMGEQKEIKGEELFEIDPNSFLPKDDVPGGMPDIHPNVDGGIVKNELSIQKEDVNFLQIEDTKTFKTIDASDNSLYDCAAVYRYSGTYCDIFVESLYSSYFTEDNVRQIAKEFDDKIRPYLYENFGSYIGQRPDDTQYYYLNTKITILVEDIRDDYYYERGNSYVAGYFWAGDLSTNNNATSMVHIDINPLMRKETSYDITRGYSTLAHEFQHLVNYTDYLVSNDQSYTNELWWNEAFSMAVQETLYGTTSTTRIGDYNNDTGNIVKNGAKLNFSEYSENNNSIAANYGMAFLFGQYLRTQTKHLTGGGDAVYKKILSSDYSDYQAIMEGLSEINYPVSDFAILNRNFRIAMVLKKSTGLYGFAGESVYNNINTPIHTGTVINLKPTSAIVRVFSSSESGYNYEPSTSLVQTGFKFTGFESAQIANYDNEEDDATPLPASTDGAKLAGPVTAAPATTVPATTAPATAVPATTVPATAAPATAAPATTAPATAAPATTVPATAAPATTVPATTAPATDAPTGTEKEFAASPKIVKQPKGKKIALKSSYKLKVSVKKTGDGVITYQWFRSKKKKGGKKIKGAVKPSYKVPSKKKGKIFYYCKITNTDTEATLKKKSIVKTKYVPVTVRKK